MQLPEWSTLQLGGSKLPDLSVEKVKDPMGGGLPDPASVAVHEVWAATVTELGLHETEGAAPEMSARLKDPEPSACEESPAYVTPIVSCPVPETGDV